MEFKEQCWFIKGILVAGYYIGYRKYHSKGTSGSVDFNWEEAFNKSTLGWYHTHPSGFLNTSHTDEKTMTGWAIAMGRPMLCGIGCDGKEKWWLYWRRKSNKDATVIKVAVSVTHVGPFIIAPYYVVSC